MSSTTNTASVVRTASEISEGMIYPHFNSNNSLSIFNSQSSPSPAVLRPLSREQGNAGTQIINYFNTNPLSHRWAILTAQMQSGKTETYLFIAAEMLRLGLIQHFVIFSGNAETALKTQIVEILTDTFPEDVYTEEERQQKSFMRKYEDYLIDNTNLRTRQILDILRTFKTKGQRAVVWGNELSKYSGSTTDTLFIWEESHFAQDQSNLPAKMLQRIGFSADGDTTLLSGNRNYVLSVSATGFSELSDNLYQTQGKLVQNLEPSAGYNSVEKMMTGGRIKSYKTIKEGLNQALSREHTTPVYSVVRVTNKNALEVTEICGAKGWRVVSHDSTTESDEGRVTWNNMKNAPTVDTVILLKGLCRMGQNIEKTHVLFCFETSKNSKTDTVLQSFVGRTCGYSTNSENVHVYLPEKTFNNGEIDRYIRMAKGEEVMPLKARNLTPLAEKVPENGRFPIIPLLFRKNDLSPSEHLAGLNAEGKRAMMLMDIRAALNAGEYENLNNPNTLNKVKQLMEKEEVELLIRRVWDKKEKRIFPQHEVVDKLINESWGRVKEQNGKWSVYPVNDPSPMKRNAIQGRGIDTTGNRVNAWTTENGDVYLECLVENEERMEEVTTSSKVARTTQKEVFCQKLEDGTEQITNGAFSINLTPMSANFVENMKSELSEIVKLSLTLTNVTTTRKINSVKGNSYKGLSLNPQVLASLQPGGSVYTHIQTTYGVSLKMVKSKAVLTSAHNILGLVRIASISW
jgi:hypothetical protein